MQFQSTDKRFSLELTTVALTKMLGTMQQAGEEETGGILLGYYSRNQTTAQVILLTGPPQDSKKGRTWFYRGVAGLGKLLTTLWRQKLYYLGEWHVHPNAVPTPSEQDKDTMRAISADPSYHCPEPILLIIGGSINAYSIRSFVFAKGQMMELGPKEDISLE